MTSVMPVDQWFSLFEFQQTHPDDNQYLWLSEYGSMTSRLMAAGFGSLKVDVVNSAHQIPVKEEQYFLELRQRKRSYIREVIMHVDNKPWMYGRTVIPTTSLCGSLGQLKLLGNKPLGKVLFEDKSTVRLFIEVAKISKAHHLYSKYINNEHSNYLWARRSLFYFHSFPLLVQEVFLPNCPFQLPDH